MLPKLYKLLYLLLFAPLFLYPRQQSLPDLLNKWEKTTNKQDTNAVNLLNSIAGEYTLRVSDSAFLYAEKALNLGNKLKHFKGLATTYITISKMHYRLGNYDLSLKAAHSSLKNINHYPDVPREADIYNVLGLIYMAQDNIDPSLTEFKKAVQINSRIKNYKRLSMNYFNIGLGYFEKDQLDSAERYLKDAKTLSIKAKDANMLAMSDNRLGEIYLKMGKTDKAITYFKTVISNKSYQNNWENTFAYSGLAKSLFTKKLYVQAINNGKLGLQIAKKIKAKWDIEQASKIIHESYAALGEHKQAYEFLKLEKQYSDSLLSEIKDKEINAINLQHKESENQVLIKKNELVNQENRMRGMIILIACLACIFLAVLLILGVRNTAKIKKLAKELHAINSTKDQLFSIISHDLRGPLASILSSLSLFKSGDLDADEQKYLFDKFFEQVSATSSMLDNLLLWANSQQSGNFVKFSKVNLPLIINEVNTLFLNATEDKNIKLNHHAVQEAIIDADHNQLTIILRNIIANAVKFTPENGEITISYFNADHFISIIIEDTGVGMSPEKLTLLFQKAGKDISTRGTNNEKGIGIGLLLVKRFVDQNNGLLSITSDEGIGTTFTLTFPKTG